MDKQFWEHTLSVTLGVAAGYCVIIAVTKIAEYGKEKLNSTSIPTAAATPTKTDELLVRLIDKLDQKQEKEQ